MTVTGKTLKQNHAKVKFPEKQKVFYRVKDALSPTGGVVGLKGTLAPEGIVKVAGMDDKLTFEGPAGFSTARKRHSKRSQRKSKKAT